jgi:hypothetical protein
MRWEMVGFNLVRFGEFSFSLAQVNGVKFGKNKGTT